ncbi:MAG: RlmE family RNA methyltransferase [Phycisphaerales bacterium]|nr:MAG: RlmE family RNA methyltransferase [Phycisphaerales bacterium]
MAREIRDHYFRRAKKEGYLSRAAYKLIEIDERRKILTSGDRVLDCGAAPGSWLQVASRRVGQSGFVIGIDLKPIKHSFVMPHAAEVRTLAADLREIPAGELLALLPAGSAAGSALFDVILSDMAPDTTGDRTIDHHQSIRLCEAVLDRCPDLLKSGGHVVIKVLEGEAYPDLRARTRRMFDAVKGFKPKASRNESTEIYLIGKGYTGGDGAPEPVAADEPAVELPRGKPSTGWAGR